jgi:glycerate 2-kinase
LHHFALVVGGDPKAPGLGAAGGAAFGLVNLCGATMRRGIELVLEATEFERRVRGADLVLTGEGMLDSTSLRGKACIGVARAALRQGVRTTALVGRCGPGAAQTIGGNDERPLASAWSLVDQCGEHSAMNQTLQALEELAAIMIEHELRG